MQKLAVWRRQEQQLVERWNAAIERHRVVHEELSARRVAQVDGAADDELVLKVRAAQAEIEALRRQVARLKREFISGERF
jgi:polyhydroxyalkanoate synthesis regulator phasin